MKRKFILALVLALAFVVALGIGAAPALAQTGCDCHTAVPPTNGAPAAHAPFVASVTDCTVCHKGMTVPHPELVEPTLTVSGRVAGIGFAIRGGLSRPWLPLAGIVVYVQAKAPAAADYIELGSPTKTDTFGLYRHGSFVTDRLDPAGDLSGPDRPAGRHARSQRAVVRPAHADADSQARWPHERRREARACGYGEGRGDAQRHGGAEGPPEGAEVGARQLQVEVGRSSS